MTEEWTSKSMMFVVKKEKVLETQRPRLGLRSNMIRYLMFFLVVGVFLHSSCINSTPSGSIGDLPENHGLSAYYDRAMEPVALAGEKDEQIILDGMAMLESVGDAQFRMQIDRLEPDQRSALRLFFSPRQMEWDAKSKRSPRFPLTASAISNSKIIDTWPAVGASRKAMGDQSLVFDEWP